MPIFHEALWVTGLSFICVSLRYIPLHRLCGGWRAEVLGAVWHWAFLLSMGYFLVRELVRFPDPSKRMPDSFRQGLPYYVNVPAHVAVWSSYLLTGIHLYHFRKCRRLAEDVVHLTFDVLLLPISFGTLALHCIRILPDRRGKDLWSATATLDAAEMWESWALWSFQSLFMRYADGCEDAKGPLYGHFKSLCHLGVQQYVVFNFSTNALEFVLRELDTYYPALCAHLWGQPATCEEVFSEIENYLTGALWYSCTIAIYSIVGFERAMSRSLHPIEPFWKFWGAKLIVSVAGVQRLVLVALTKFGLMTEVFSWYVHAYLLCFETFFLSLLHFRAYPASGYFKFASTLHRLPGHAVGTTVYGRIAEDPAHDEEEIPPQCISAETTVPSASAQGISLRPSSIGRPTGAKDDALDQAAGAEE